MENDIINTCRICFGASDCQNIFDLNYEGLDIVDILAHWVKIELSKEEHNPDYVCMSCINDLIGAYETVTKWQRSYGSLNDARNNTKDEEEIYIEVLDDGSTEENDCFKCGLCSKEFATGKDLHKHERTYHRNNKKSSANKHCYVCEICSKSFETRKDFQDHKNGICLENDAGKDAPITCKLCSAPAISIRALRQHYSTVHCKKEFLCSECGRGFITSAGLKLHLNTHNGEKNFTCKICDKKFVQKHSLKHHMYTHTGEKPYCCEICGKSFTQQHHMTIHKRRHSGLRPYSCHICGKTFTLKGNLTVHIRTHTGETPYVCQICGAGYHDSSSLKKHVVKHDSTGGLTDGRIDVKFDVR